MFDAFISYSHAVDGKLAPALQSAIRRFGRSWYQRSALRIFRDESDLSVSPGLWDSIEKALGASEHLILLASPKAAVSKWVAREIDYWLTNKSAATLLIVVTDGTLVWDDTVGDFDWTMTTSLPGAMAGSLAREPLYLDLRAVDRTELVALDNPGFRDVAASLAAVLLHREKSELVGEDIAVRKRARRVVWSAASVLIAMVVLLGFSTWFALSQRDALGRTLVVVQGQKLAAEARLLQADSPSQIQTSALLAIEAMGVAPSPEAESFLRTTIETLLPPAASFGAAIRSPRPDARAVVSTVFSPDSRFVLTTGDEPGARLWDITTGKQVKRFVPATAADEAESPVGAAFSAGGRSIVTMGPDGLSSWDVASGQQTMQRDERDNVTSFAASPDGRLVATGSIDGSVKLIEIQSGRTVPLGRHAIIVNAVAFSPDGRWLASGSNDKTAKIWDVATRREVQSLPHNFGVRAVAFSPDGKSIATGGWERTARIWSVASARELTSFDQRTVIQALAFSADGQRLAVAGDDALTRVWDLATGVEVGRATHSGAVSSIAFSPDGRWLATASPDRAEVWKARYGSEIAHFPVADEIVTDVAFSPDGQQIVAAAGRNAMVWNVDDGRLSRLLEHDADLENLSFGADGKRVVATTKSAVDEPVGTCVHVWIGDSQTTSRLACHDALDSAVDARGSRVALFDRDGDVHVQDLERNDDLVLSIPISATAFVTAMALGTRHVAAFVADPEKHEGVVEIRETVAGGAQVRARTIVVREDVQQLAFGPDDSTIAAATNRGFHVWNLSTGQEVSFVEFPGGAQSIAVSRMGWVATGGFDQSVRIWQFPDAREVARFELGGSISRVAFSPDSELVAAASSDRTARVWRWRHADLIDEACKRLTRNLSQTEWRAHFADRPYHATCPGLATPP